MSVKNPLPEDEAVGQKIRQHRLARRMSQTELANHLGVTFQQIQKYEKGVNRVSAGRLQVISQLFDVAITELMGPQRKPGKSKTEDPMLMLGQSREGHRLAAAFNTLDGFQDVRMGLVTLVERVAQMVQEVTAKA